MIISNNIELFLINFKNFTYDLKAMFSHPELQQLLIYLS